jgi:hypothetical protein
MGPIVIIGECKKKAGLITGFWADRGCFFKGADSVLVQFTKPFKKVWLESILVCPGLAGTAFQVDLTIITSLSMLIISLVPFSPNVNFFIPYK